MKQNHDNNTIENIQFGANLDYNLVQVSKVSVLVFRKLKQLNTNLNIVSF